MPGSNLPKPRVLLLIDKWDWAFHTIARAIMEHLGNRYAFDLKCTADQPILEEDLYDIVHVFYEYESYHRRFLRGKARLVKGVYSHYWQEWGLSAAQLYDTHLREAHAITVPNTFLLEALRDLPPAVHLVSEGVDTRFFTPDAPRTGPIVAGWCGDPTRDIKRFPWAKQACDGICELKVADGSLDAEGMRAFYRSIDVILCCSKGEGSPRPILEGMACGNFPVSFDVGVAHELIRHEENGLLVRDQSVESLREAIRWCDEQLPHVRARTTFNAERIRAGRQWPSTLKALQDVYDGLL
jgi:hypothetical protein